MHLGITELRTKAKLVLSAQLALSQWKDVNPRALLIDVCCFRRRGEIALDLLKGHSKRFLFTFAGMLVTPKKWIFVNALKNHRKKINLSVIYYMYIFPLKLALVKNLQPLRFFLSNSIKSGFWFIYHTKGVMVSRCVALIITFLPLSKCQ